MFFLEDYKQKWCQIQKKKKLKIKIRKHICSTMKIDLRATDASLGI